MKQQISESGNSRTVLVLFFALLCLCGAVLIPLAWNSMYQPAMIVDDYMNGKMIVAWRETVKENVPDPNNSKKTIKVVWTKIHFVSSGKTFPEGDVLQRVVGSNGDCGDADGVLDMFKVFDANPGGIMRWSYRGNMPMGDGECPVGEFVPYPHYNPDLDPESLGQRLTTLQDCWISVWGPQGLQEKLRCGHAEYYGYANIKGVSPPGNSAEVFHFLVMSDDGISAIPFSKLQEVLRDGGIEISLNQFFEIIDQINASPENPVFRPIWETWRWK